MDIGVIFKSKIPLFRGDCHEMIMSIEGNLDLTLLENCKSFSLKLILDRARRTDKDSRYFLENLRKFTV